MSFSVVIIALNEENYISNILKCLTEQTYKNFEVVVVDGKSEDKTIEVVKKFKNRLDLNIVISDKRGPSYQRNLGAKRSKYENIIFFDADIAITTDFIEKLKRFLIKYKVDCTTGLYKAMEPSIFNNFSMFVQNTGILFFGKISPVATGAFMFCNKNAFNQVGGFAEDILYAEDSDFVKRVHKAGFHFKVFKKPKVVFSCRRFEKEGSLKLSLKLARAQIRILFGERFDNIKKINYKFGHYNKD